MAGLVVYREDRKRVDKATDLESLPDCQYTTPRFILGWIFGLLTRSKSSNMSGSLEKLVKNFVGIWRGEGKSCMAEVQQGKQSGSEQSDDSSS